MSLNSRLARKTLLQVFFCLVITLGPASVALAAEKLGVLIISGQMNKYHNAQLMNEALVQYLTETGLFSVDIAKSPGAGEDMSGFRPEFERYDVVISNYDGDDWPPETRADFARFVHEGGGFVTVHSSNNAFPRWQEYLDITGLGGWGDLDEGILRDKTWGPALRWVDGEVEFYTGPGQTFHPPKHDFPITFRDSSHPITSGLPTTWLHAHDELYSMMRGPAENLHLLATGFADPEVENASGFHEPAIFTVTYGQGRVFHTTLGHIGRDETGLPESVRCLGFITTVQRGVEWAATGRVTQAAPLVFPGPGRRAVRD